MVGRSNTIMVFENPVNRFLRGNWPLKELQGGISLQVILDRLSSWDATQSLGRLIANVQDALNHQGMNPGRGMDAGPGMPLQDVLESNPLSQFLSKPFEPFLDPPF